MMEDDIKTRIEKLKASTSTTDFNRQRKRANSRIEQVQEDARFFYRFYLQVAAAAIWVWWWIIRPVMDIVWRIGLILFSWYRKLWSFFVYRRNKFGDLKFSKIRAGAFLVLSIPVLLGFMHISIDGTIFAFTYKHNETIYLFNAADNSFSEADEFSITGCEITEMKSNEFSCDSNDTVYFRVQGDWIDHIYSILTTGHIFYTDAIGSAIAPGWNVCTTSSWYFRWKTVMRNTNIYPKMLAVSCKPLPTGG